MTSLLVTGYKSFELGVFKDNDPKVTFIKKLLSVILSVFWMKG